MKPASREIRLLFVNRSYWPDAEATGQLLTELCEDLADSFQVTVLVGQPNQNPLNEPFRRVGCESHNGVTVCRVPHWRLPKAWPVGRLLNWGSFLVAAWIRTLFLKRPDIVIVESDPFLLPLLGAWLRVWHRSRLVVYLQDIYPDIALAVGKARNSPLVRLLRRALFAIHRRADRVVVLSRDMQQLLTESGVPRSRITCIPNWTDTTCVIPIKEDNAFRASHRLDHHFVVMHSGNIGLTQRLEHLLAAAEYLRDRPEILILIVGDGASRPALERRAAERRLTNVRFLPYQPREQLAQSLSAADVHLISTDPAALKCLMPSKLYGILASGTAVLAIAPETSELAEIIHENAVGRTVRPGAPEELADAIRWCADHPHELREMGRAARRLAEEEYDRRRSVARFAQLLRDLLNEPLAQSDEAEAVVEPLTAGTGGLAR